MGTPPNLIGLALIEQGTGLRMNFVQWMLFGVPLALVLFAVLFGIILVLFRPEIRTVPGQLEHMQRARQALGPLSVGERNTLLAFGVAVLLWVGPGLVGLAVGSQHPAVRFFAERFPEGAVALLAACLLFLLPTNWRKREFTLRWDDAIRVDWGTILLFGGGIALGRMMLDTGLAHAMGRGFLTFFGIHQPATLTGAAVGLATLISETTSNTASANMVVPIMLSMARALGASGVAVGVAATLGASMGFMLPISTPPNAIVYGSKAIRLTDMVRAGLLLDLLGFVIIWMWVLWIVPLAAAIR